MRYIRDLISARPPAGRPLISFEFFTPKTEEGDRVFSGKVLPSLLSLNPDYCSVTYGAGGSSRDKTLGMVDLIQREGQIPAMAHLTCVGSTRDQIEDLLCTARKLNISNILALRGDPPVGSTTFQKPENGFSYAHELVSLTRSFGGFCIGVAGFPEGHLECKEGRETDWRRLKAKIECGADFVVTQLFFDNRFFYELRDYLTLRLGVKVPIIPGVIPILSTSQIKRFTALCGSSMPEALLKRLDEMGDDDAAVGEFGIEFATRQCEDLIRNGVPGIHFYTLNKVQPCTRILRNLNLA